MKSYRENELKYYVVAVILVYYIIVDNITLISISNTTGLSLVISGVFNFAVASSSLYIFTLLLDSVYSDKSKRLLVHLWRTPPGQTIFSDILTKSNPVENISPDKAKKHYSKIYEELEKILDSNEKRSFEDENWYAIYHGHKNVDMIVSSLKDYRICRDIYISTINIILLYNILCLPRFLSFEPRYLVFLFTMLLISKIATRNKDKILVYNVITYDYYESTINK